MLIVKLIRYSYFLFFLRYAFLHFIKKQRFSYAKSPQPKKNYVLFQKKTTFFFEKFFQKNRRFFWEVLSIQKALLPLIKKTYIFYFVKNVKLSSKKTKGFFWQSKAFWIERRQPLVFEETWHFLLCKKCIRFLNFKKN